MTSKPLVLVGVHSDVHYLSDKFFSEISYDGIPNSFIKHVLGWEKSPLLALVNI